MSEIEKFDPRETSAPTSGRMFRRLRALDRVRSSDMTESEKATATSLELHTHYCWVAGSILFVCDAAECPGYTWSTSLHPHPCTDLREALR